MIEDSVAPGDRRRRHHRLDHRRPARRGRRRRDPGARQLRPRPPGEPRRRPWPRAGSDVDRGRHPRRRRSCARSTAGTDLVFHQAAIRITQCAEEPRLALEVLVGRHLQRPRGRGRRRACARSSPPRRPRSTGWPTSSRPPSGTTRTTTTPSTARPRSFNEGMLRSFHAMHGLDYVALRYFNVYGPRMDIHGLYTEVLIRWMERIEAGEPPLILGDGQQTMDFVYTTDIARANLLAARGRRHRRRCSTSAAAPRRACSSSPRRCCAVDGQRPVGRVRPGARGQRRDPAAGRHRRGRGASSGLKAEVGPRRGPAAAWWPGGGRERTPTGRASRMIPVMKPWLGDEEAAAAAEAVRSGWVAQGPRVAEFERAFAARVGRRARRRRLLVHDRPCTWPCIVCRRRARRRGRRPVASRSSPPRTAARYVGATPVFADVELEARQPQRPDGRGGPDRAHPRRHRRPPGRRARRLDADPGAVRPPRDRRWSRTPPAPPGRRYRGSPVGAGRRSLAAWSFHPRKLLTTGEGGMLTTSDDEVAARAAPPARARHGRQRGRTARRAGSRSSRATSRSGSTTG